eukprot:3273103-Amphidinium_carterae.2
MVRKWRLVSSSRRCRRHTTLDQRMLMHMFVSPLSDDYHPRTCCAIQVPPNNNCGYLTVLGGNPPECTLGFPARPRVCRVPPLPITHIKCHGHAAAAGFSM